ncbi:MAG: alanine racemase [Bacilli bacterium]
MRDLLYQEIDLKVIGENWDAIKQKSQKDIIAVVKSRCYGLGDQRIPKFLETIGCKILAVVDEQEALRLLESNIKTNVLVLNSVSEEFYQMANLYSNLIFSVNCLSDSLCLSNYSFNRKVKLHVQIDTGMNRLGFTNLSDYSMALTELLKNPNLQLEGLYTHFASPEYREQQETRFRPFLKTYPYSIIHCAASSTYEYSKIGNFVRVGLDLYGDGRKPHIKQSVRVGCFPLAINFVKKGESIGYDQAYKVTEDMYVAVLPIGYYNGFRRSLRGMTVLANQKRYQTIGIVCMNHLFVKVDEQVNIDTEFIITSLDLPMYELAQYLQTTPHEIWCMLNIDNKIYIE